MTRRIATLCALAISFLVAAAPVLADTDADRASWLLHRADGLGGGLPPVRHHQADVGGVSEVSYFDEGPTTNGSVGLKMLASAVLPGSGEVLLGHKRGFAIMALDILAWTQVAGNHSDGEDATDAYYAFADEHYSDALLIEAYYTGSLDIERSGEGDIYFPDWPTIGSTDLAELEKLPLYVTKEEDRREYYENLGKWDQFVFGWDDYQRASVDRPEYDYTTTHAISDLRQPWVSKNRDIYRTMRAEANDAYATRDRWLFLNIGLRVFSVLETAWLGGLMGDRDDSMAVAGHKVELVTAPTGPYRGRVGAKIWF